MRKLQIGSLTDPFIDLMLTLSIVFFLIVLILLGVIRLQSNTYNRIMQDNARLTKIVEDREYDQLERDNKELKQKNEALNKEFTLIKKESAELVDKARAQAEVRTNLYAELTQKLNDAIGRNSVSLKGTQLVISADSYYKSGASDMTEEAKAKARIIGKTMAEFLDAHNNDALSTVKIKYIEVSGHTDNVGSYTINDRLGAERAYKFVSVMLDGLTADGRRTRVDYGKYFRSSSMSLYEPIDFPNADPNNRSEFNSARNRRIEISIIFTDDDLSRLVDEFAKSSALK